MTEIHSSNRRHHAQIPRIATVGSIEFKGFPDRWADTCRSNDHQRQFRVSFYDQTIGFLYVSTALSRGARESRDNVSIGLDKGFNGLGKYEPLHSTDSGVRSRETSKLG